MTKQPAKSKKRFLICSLFVLLILSLFLFLNSPLFRVELSVSESQLEIGTNADAQPSTYLNGPKWSTALSYIDTSSVNHTKVGRYPIYIYHGFQKFTSYVNVMDSTPPVVTSNVKNKTMVSGDKVSVHNLGLDIKDHSNIERILFTKITSNHFYTDLPEKQTQGIREAYAKGIPIEAEEFQFAYGGVYTLTISVTDSFYNTSETELTITVEAPPVIEVNNDFYVADTEEIDLKKYVKVWDFLSNDINTDNIKIDTSQLKLSSNGTYPVTITATDPYGLTTSKTINVHVSTQDALQELINTHMVDLSTNIIIGAKNAYDSGYYTSSNLASIQKAMLPTIVNIKNNTNDSYGSGFIIEINDSFVTIATNEHVIKNDLEVDITFFDAVKCCGAVVAANAEKDIAFVRIPIKEMDTNSISALSDKYVQKLRTVHINKAYWDTLSNDCGIVIGYNCIDANGQIWKTSTGHLTEKEALRNLDSFQDVPCTIISSTYIPGTSGSALFDCYGHLVGMMRGTTTYKGHTENVAVPLNEILKYFEYVFKYKIHYQ